MTQSIPRILSLILFCAVLGCAGCGQQSSEPAPGQTDVIPISTTQSIRQGSPDRSLSSKVHSHPAPIYAKDVAPLFEKYCLNCHDAAGAEGGVVLEDFSNTPDAKLTPLLIRVAENLRSESMPPEGEPRPDAAELEIICDWIDGATMKTQRATGRPLPRRLNRAQYNNTVRDLFGLDLRPADEFPSDDVGYGFDNIGEVLSTSPILVEMYVAAAENVVNAAFQSPERRATTMNPPPDFMPPAFRRYKPTVRSPRENKVLRTTPIAVDPELQRQQGIYNILRALADRAYRRPVSHDELTRLLELVVSAENDGEAPESALRLALEAVLLSPHFLFIGVEQSQGPGLKAGALPEQDFELAANLSYFLWSSMPDDELLRLASQAALRRPDVLEPQVRRMLRDRRSRALAEQFASQWLQTRKLSTFTPDPKLFPQFDSTLKRAMLEEAELFFASILEEDRSVLDFLEADYTFVNERLARHYGIKGVDGEAFRRVSLEGTSRGGVITMASVLTATSNPTRTSPVKRGRWILENILGAPPAPPPAGVEALKEDSGIVGTRTLRQQMEQHRSNPACASCHRRMDPLGFALENFDAVGAWRAEELGQGIEADGRLPGGRAFRGPEGLRSALLSRRIAFTRCLTEKMLTYAIGRGVDQVDKNAIEEIVRRLARNNYRFSELVLGIALSEPFRKRESAPEGS
jgi:Protein of unknown function (DUF1592)/Protein of unknown function (DUF1588)/Protein of unknown function (DUF1587)/Protein of unknown function (DUF1585)/Protein of unknown function (DUF1595)/Cytochrome C oxidase, cbb3-type, subunit III